MALTLADEAYLLAAIQRIEENIFRRLQGKILSITPVYVQRDDHAKGLFHLLTLAARLLALGDYTAKQALAQENAKLAGIYPGNPIPRFYWVLTGFDGNFLAVTASPRAASAPI